MRRAIAATAALLFLAATLLGAAATPADGAKRLFRPPSNKIYFGVTDTGEAAGFRDFRRAVGKHPPIIETYHPWGNSLHDAIPRWRSVKARPILHISTAEGDGTEVITPRAIARGMGDGYLLRLNRSLARQHIRAYIRPLGEPNRCLNPYAAVDCSGYLRGGPYAHKWYRQAFRRMYVVFHGGARRWKINRRLERLHLPRLRRRGGKVPRWLPRAPVALIWSPLPGGSPETRANRPGRYYPGDRYVDWVGTDFYSRYPYWGDLRRFYRRYAARRDKPFALTEFGVWGSDSPRFVRRLFGFMKRRPKAKMLVYYQDFGSSNEFRIQNFPFSRNVIRQRLDSRRFPALASGFPRRTRR
jgi:hypothetical protein